MTTKEINLDNVFSLFSLNEDLEGNNDTVYIDFTNSPIYWLGMYKKLVLNHINQSKKIIKSFKSFDIDFDIEDAKKAGESIIFNRAWLYIKNINPNSPYHLEIIKKHSDPYFDTSLELGIKFFVKCEEYEKCSLFQKILDKSKEFQL